MSSMPSKLLSRRDLDFLLYEWLDAPALTARPRYAEHSRETFDAALDASQKLATALFAPRVRATVAGAAGSLQGKRAACRYFFAYELPRVRPMLELLGSLDTTTLEMREAWF